MLAVTAILYLLIQLKQLWLNFGFIIVFTAISRVINAAKMVAASAGLFGSCYSDFTAINTAKTAVAEFWFLLLLSQRLHGLLMQLKWLQLVLVFLVAVTAVLQLLIQLKRPWLNYGFYY